MAGETPKDQRRRTDTQVLHPVVVERLGAWLATKPEVAPDDLLFHLRTPGGWWRKTAKMMRADLSAARAKWVGEAESDQERARREASDFLTYQDEDGLFADFHSHRHTFISNLGKAKVPLGTARKLARHSTPVLTSNVYTHLKIADHVAAAGESGDERARTANPRPAKPVGTLKFPENDADFPKGGASGAALEPEMGPSDPGLAMVVRRWESLPEVVRRAILAMVKAAGRE